LISERSVALDGLVVLWLAVVGWVAVGAVTAGVGW
jgi:hypothetical protein